MCETRVYKISYIGKRTFGNLLRVRNVIHEFEIGYVCVYEISYIEIVFLSCLKFHLRK